MFRLATLVAVAAASTASKAEADADKDESKAKAQVTAAANTVKSAISGKSKVIDLEMPNHDGSALTYADMSADHELHCTLASGATWVPKVDEVKAEAKTATKAAVKHVAAVAAHCDVSKTEKAKDVLTLDADLTYEGLFDALAGAAKRATDGQTDVKDKDSFVYQDGAVLRSNVACPVAYDDATFGEKAQAKTGTVEYSWEKNDETTAGQWCYSQTFMPKTFSGGLLLTHTAAKDTQVAVKVDNTLDRYFNDASLVSMAIGKTGKIPLTGADTIEVYMAQNNKWVAADKGESFKLTFTRASYADIALLTAEHGGAVTWIIIGCVVLVACIVGVVVWKCFCSKKKDSEDEFYYSDDLYARV